MISRWMSSLHLQPLYARADASTLGVARSVVFVLLFVNLMLFPAGMIAGLPDSIAEPVGPLRLLSPEAWSLLVSEVTLQVLKWIGVLAVVASVLGVRPFPLVGIPAVAVAFLLDAITKSFGGFVNHGQFAMLYMALLLVLYPCADGFSVMGNRPRREDARLYGAPLLLGALILALAYTFVGVTRLLHGGWEVMTGESLRVWLVMRSLDDSLATFQHGVWLSNSPLGYRLALVMFAVVTICEVATIPAVFHARWRLVWMVVMVPFHFTTLFTMNIIFWENVILMLALFTPVCAWIGNRFDACTKQELGAP